VVERQDSSIPGGYTTNCGPGYAGSTPAISSKHLFKRLGSVGGNSM